GFSERRWSPWKRRGFLAGRCLSTGGGRTASRELTPATILDRRSAAGRKLVRYARRMNAESFAAASSRSRVAAAIFAPAKSIVTAGGTSESSLSSSVLPAVSMAVSSVASVKRLGGRVFFFTALIS